jgi:hypothetical protein
MEGLGQLKNTMPSSGIEPMTFWLIAQCLNEHKYEGKSKSLCPYFFSATIIYIQGNQNTDSVLSTFDYFST